MLVLFCNNVCIIIIIENNIVEFTQDGFSIDDFKNTGMNGSLNMTLMSADSDVFCSLLLLNATDSKTNFLSLAIETPNTDYASEGAMAIWNKMLQSSITYDNFVKVLAPLSSTQVKRFLAYTYQNNPPLSLACNNNNVKAALALWNKIVTTIDDYTYNDYELIVKQIDNSIITFSNHTDTFLSVAINSSNDNAKIAIWNQILDTGYTHDVVLLGSYARTTIPALTPEQLDKFFAYKDPDYTNATMLSLAIMKESSVFYSKIIIIFQLNAMFNDQAKTDKYNVLNTLDGLSILGLVLNPTQLTAYDFIVKSEYLYLAIKDKNNNIVSKIISYYGNNDMMADLFQGGESSFLSDDFLLFARRDTAKAQLQSLMNNFIYNNKFIDFLSLTNSTSKFNNSSLFSYLMNHFYNEDINLIQIIFTTLLTNNLYYADACTTFKTICPNFTFEKQKLFTFTSPNAFLVYSILSLTSGSVKFYTYIYDNYDQNIKDIVDSIVNYQEQITIGDTSVIKSVFTPVQKYNITGIQPTDVDLKAEIDVQTAISKLPDIQIASNFDTLTPAAQWSIVTPIFIQAISRTQIDTTPLLQDSINAKLPTQPDIDGLQSQFNSNFTNINEVTDVILSRTYDLGIACVTLAITKLAHDLWVQPTQTSGSTDGTTTKPLNNTKNGLSSLAITGIVTGSTIGLGIIIYFAHWIIKKYSN